MRALEVDPLSGSVRGQQNPHERIVKKRLLGLAAIFATHAPVNGDDARRPAEKRCNASLKIVQRVPVRDLWRAPEDRRRPDRSGLDSDLFGRHRAAGGASAEGPAAAAVRVRRLISSAIRSLRREP